MSLCTFVHKDFLLEKRLTCLFQGALRFYLGGENMFKKVTSQKEQEAFAATWEYFCERNGWHKDPYAQTGERYQLLLSKRDPTVIGTIEFIPYHEEVEVERYFRFSKIPSIFQQQDRVWEIDKLCLHKDYHRQGYFFHFLKSFMIMPFFISRNII